MPALQHSGGSRQGACATTQRRQQARCLRYNTAEAAGKVPALQRSGGSRQGACATTQRRQQARCLRYNTVEAAGKMPALQERGEERANRAHEAMDTYPAQWTEEP